MFPEAQSFLDAGCAKGFLVRTLREKGKEAWGFDHSSCALERAEQSVKPFVRRASVEDVHCDEPIDMLLAFSLFECLTEEQALSFLRQARGWTRQALLAVITVADDTAAETSDDRDLSHMTLRPRAWWHKLLLRAGWRQDSLHRMAERICREHPLPKKMGWEVFLYSAQG